MEPLMSQRYVPHIHHHPRPQCSNLLQTITLPQPHPHSQSQPQLQLQPPSQPPIHTINTTTTLTSANHPCLASTHSPSTPTPTPTPPPTPFPLLSLPLELQTHILTQLYTPWSATLTHERLSMFRSKIHLHGAPSPSLLLVSRCIHALASPLFTSQFTGRLTLTSVFILVALRRKERFAWLRDRVTTLCFADGSVHPERWNRYYETLPRLRRLEIEFAGVVELALGLGGEEDGTGVEMGMREVLEGRRDEMLLEGVDRYRLAIVDQLSGELEVVVRQRFVLGVGEGEEDGVLDVRILLAKHGATIVEREYVCDSALVVAQ